MPYIIDGHNLIPKIPGLSLQDLDDEMKLIQLLQEFARINQVSIELYFDRAPTGFAKTQQLGRVKVIFVSEKTIADDRIIKRIKTLGRTAREWVVVTSDRRIQADAKESNAIQLSSEDFARKMAFSLEQARGSKLSSQKMTDEELESWLKLFDQNK